MDVSNREFVGGDDMYPFDLNDGDWLYLDATDAVSEMDRLVRPWPRVPSGCADDADDVGELIDAAKRPHSSSTLPTVLVREAAVSGRCGFTDDFEAAAPRRELIDFRAFSLGEPLAATGGVFVVNSPLFQKPPNSRFDLDLARFLGLAGAQGGEEFAFAESSAWIWMVLRLA